MERIAFWRKELQGVRLYDGRDKKERVLQSDMVGNERGCCAYPLILFH